MNWNERYAASSKKPIDLQWTVVHHPLPDFIVEAVNKVITSSNLYPLPEELEHLLEKKHKLEKGQVIVTAGADYSLLTLGLLYGKNSHMFTPGYNGYLDIEKFPGYKVTQHDSMQDGSYIISTDKIPNASLIYVTNPNNPAGFTGRDRVLELVKNNKQAHVIVDEAYGEFAPELSVIDEVNNHKNLTVVRSFSKAYAMAGMRVGYTISNKKVIKDMDTSASYFAVSKPSLAAAISALKHEDYFKQVRQEVINERIKTEEYLKHQGYKVVDSKYNGILIKFPTVKEATAFLNKAKKNNILIDQGSGDANVGLSGEYIRVAVGNPSEMKKFRDIL